ncbi:DedA family protein [Ottowia sp.]|uniref:DedA family protein n=1 Tax=Ottowia sp. TaxID=1898956 RepID=UPI0039E60566
MEAWLQSLLHALALAQYGLSTVFALAFASATLPPLGSEPAVFGLVTLNPQLFWPAIALATAWAASAAGGWAARRTARWTARAARPRTGARCAGWMALGKFLRYLAMTAALPWLWPEQAPSAIQ